MLLNSGLLFFNEKRLSASYGGACSSQFVQILLGWFFHCIGIRKEILARQDIEQVFTDIIERAKHLDAHNSRKWFDDLRLVHLNGGSLMIGCEDQAKQQYQASKAFSGLFLIGSKSNLGHQVQRHESAKRPADFLSHGGGGKY